MSSAGPDQVEEFLNEAGDTYLERNAIYKDNFRRVGDAMKALFPEGVNLATSEDFARWHILELIMVKLTRYATQYSSGGHRDSLQDLTVYAGILAKLDAEEIARNAEHGVPENAYGDEGF